MPSGGPHPQARYDATSPLSPPSTSHWPNWTKLLSTLWSHPGNHSLHCGTQRQLNAQIGPFVPLPTLIQVLEDPCIVVSKVTARHVSLCRLLELSFHHEDGGNFYLRNVGKFTADYTAPSPVMIVGPRILEG